MRPTLPVLLAALTATLLPQAAGANSSMQITITAHVNAFCRIGAPDNPQIALTNGAARIGAISEICNTPDGYDVQTQFQNLNGGRLNVAGKNYKINNSGIALRSSSEPRVQTLDWQIADASMVAADQPIIMHVTISPH